MYKKTRRIIAWIGIILLVGLYIAALVSALIATPFADSLFIAALYSTFVIPAFIFVLEIIYKYVHKDNAVDKTDVNRMKKEDKETK